MKELIKENTIFYTTIDGNRYKCYIYSKLQSNWVDVSQYINVQKINIKKLKFLFWNYFVNIVEWEVDYFIGTNKLFGSKCINSELINGNHYYSIEDIKFNVKLSI